AVLAELVVVPAAGLRDICRARVGNSYPVARVTLHVQDDAAPGEVQHVCKGEGDGVVAASGKIDTFDRFDARGAAQRSRALLRDGGEIERDAATLERERVEPAAAVHAHEPAGV